MNANHDALVADAIRRIREEPDKPTVTLFRCGADALVAEVERLRQQYAEYERALADYRG